MPPPTLMEELASDDLLERVGHYVRGWRQWARSGLGNLAIFNPSQHADE